MCLGFTIISRPIDLEVHLSTPDARDSPALVAFFQWGNSFALLMGRLYYQQDVLSKLVPRCPADLLSVCASNAAAVALAVYRHLGLGSLDCLEGDFALAIWDAEHAQLIGMRDPMGGYPLFWTDSKGTIALSTSLRSLLTLHMQHELNREYIADFLMMPAPGQEGSSERCAYTGIERILPGTIVRLGIDSRRVERQGYWNWLERIRDPGIDDVVEVAEQYRPLLRAAVQERLVGRTLAHLSGGMDSTSVALIARDLVHAGRGEAPLHTLSLVYQHLSGLARERPYIEGVLQSEQEIVAHRLPADDLLDFDSFLDAPPHEEPYANLWRLAMDRATVEVAATVGAVTMLTGLGADEIHNVHPYYLTDLLRQGHILKVWQEASRWAQAYNCSPWAIVQPFALAPLAPRWQLKSGLGRTWDRRGHGRLNTQDDYTIPPWIVPDFARRYALESHAVANAQRMYRLCHQTGLSITLSTLMHRPGDVLRWSVASPLGIAIAHPFLDVRLLSFGLGMQLRIQPEPGSMKPVLAQAMRDILPANIRERRRKGHFNEIFYLGLSRNRPYLETMLRQAPQETWEIFNKDLLLQCLQEASLAGTNPRQLQRLNYTLSLIKWLSMQSHWLQTEQRPTQSIRVPR